MGEPVMKQIYKTRPSISEVFDRLGEKATHKQRLILLDLDAKSTLCRERMGCIVITSPVWGSFTYHVQNNAVVE